MMRIHDLHEDCPHCFIQKGCASCFFWDVSICCCRSFPCVAKRIRKPHSRGDVLIFIIHIFVYSYLYLFIGSCFANLPIASCAVLDC